MSSELKTKLKQRKKMRETEKRIQKQGIHLMRECAVALEPTVLMVSS